MSQQEADALVRRLNRRIAELGGPDEDDETRTPRDLEDGDE